MSTIKLNGASSGSSIIKAPDSGSTNQTFTLPASTGTLVTTTDAGVAGITSTADANAITIDSSENVLVGTTSALALGDVAAGKMQLISTGGNALRFNIGCGGASAEPRMDINTATTTTAATGSINFTKTHNNTLTTKTDVVQGEALGSINFSGVSRSNGSYNSGAFIKAFVSSTGTVGSTYVPTDLWLGTQDTSTNRASAPQLKIMSDGRGLSQFTAKGWVQFDGSGTLSVKDSHNVSSVTDSSNGHYEINWSNNMANDDYSVSATSGHMESGDQTDSYSIISFRGSGIYTSKVEVQCIRARFDIQTMGDPKIVCLVAFGD